MSLDFTKHLRKKIFIVATLLISTNAFAQDFQVDINRTQVVYLPVAASAIVIGNPEIADISVHSADTVFLVGRGYGETNLIVLDQAGQKVMDANVVVTSARAPSSVRILNLGKGNKTYSCTPYCSPAPVLGDSPDFVNTYSGSDININNLTATGPLANSTLTQPPNSVLQGSNSN